MADQAPQDSGSSLGSLFPLLASRLGLSAALRMIGGPLGLGMGALGGFGGNLLGGALFGKSPQASMGSGFGGGVGALAGSLMLPGIGSLLGGFGGGFLGDLIGSLFAHTPTRGTRFRQGLQGEFKQLGLPSFNRASGDVYGPSNKADPLNPFPQYGVADKTAAQQMATLISQFAPQYASDPLNYTNQTFNILMNTLGNQAASKLNPLIAQLQGQGVTPIDVYTRTAQGGLSPGAIALLSKMGVKNAQTM